MERNKTRRMLVSIVALVAVMGSLASCRDRPPWWQRTSTTRTPTTGPGGGGETPIIFVHGIVGSGDQYRSIALHFTSNGYPIDRIQAFDYNSTGTLSIDTALNAMIDRARQQFGTAKVHLVGHSLGTSHLTGFMGNDSNAAKVDKVVLVDGFPCGSIPGCLTLSAASMGQTHVEASVSSESFARQYAHLIGRQPSVRTVVPEDAAEVTVAGRVQEFVTNAPMANAEVVVWEVDPDTGHRVSDSPAASTTTRSDGTFGPSAVPQGKPYEIELNRPGSAGTLHAYYQPFIRSDHLLRLNTTSPTSANYTNSNRGPNHSAISIVRNREFWILASHGAQRDRLTIQTTTTDGRSQPEVNVLQNVSGKDVVGVHVHDNTATPGESSLALLNYFSAQAFQTGVDVFMPAADPPNGTISVRSTPRGDSSKVQTINLANWPSEGNGMTVHFNDWVS